MSLIYGEPVAWTKKLSKGYPYVVFTQFMVGAVIAFQAAKFSLLLGIVVFFAIFLPHFLLVLGIKKVGEVLNKQNITD